MQSCITPNDDCLSSANSVANQLALYWKVSLEIPTCWKSLTTEKVIGCELKMERNVCRRWLMDENTASVAQPLLDIVGRILVGLEILHIQVFWTLTPASYSWYYVIFELAQQDLTKNHRITLGTFRILDLILLASSFSSERLAYYANVSQQIT